MIWLALTVAAASVLALFANAARGPVSPERQAAEDREQLAAIRAWDRDRRESEEHA